MKYRDFCTFLMFKVDKKVIIQPGISVYLNENRVSSGNFVSFPKSCRFVLIPLKIYGENVNHLNLLILDNKTKVIERFEPFNRYLNFDHINELLEPLLYKLMKSKNIYFLKYETSLNKEEILSDRNCGMYCINYAVLKTKVKEA